MNNQPFTLIIFNLITHWLILNKHVERKKWSLCTVRNRWIRLLSLVEMILYIFWSSWQVQDLFVFFPFLNFTSSNVVSATSAAFIKKLRSCVFSIVLHFPVLRSWNIICWYIATFCCGFAWSGIDSQPPLVLPLGHRCPRTLAFLISRSVLMM